MHANQRLAAPSANQPVAAPAPKARYRPAPITAPAVAHLARLQRMADAGAADVAQLYEKETVKGQDGFFVPRMKAAIHCHVGNKMRNPHLKIQGDVYSFGNPQQDSRIKDAYDALVGDPRNAALAGYEDCREYLCELLGIEYKAPQAADAGARAAAAGGGSGAGGGKKGKSRGKKKR